MNRFFGLSGGVNSGMGVGMGIVSPANVPLPVPVLLASGTPLPVAVAPVPPNAVPLAPVAAPVVSAASSAAVAATPVKNGYSVSGTPPPLETTQVGSATATTSQQQQPHAQTHPQQPRFLYAAPTPGAPYGAQPQLQLYAFHPPTSFYTPTLLQVTNNSSVTLIITYSAFSLSVCLSLSLFLLSQLVNSRFFVLLIKLSLWSDGCLKEPTLSFAWLNDTHVLFNRFVFSNRTYTVTSHLNRMR